MKNYKYSFLKANLSIIILLSLILIKPLAIFSGNVIIGNGDNVFKIKENTYSKFAFVSSPGSLSYSKVVADKSSYIRLNIQGYGSSNDIGKPELPVLRKLIEIPEGAQVKITVVSYQLAEYKLDDYGILQKIYPAQPPVSKDPKKKPAEFKFDQLAYSSDNFNSNDLVTVERLGSMRGTEIGRMDIAPVRYNPVTNTIQVYSDITVEISFEQSDIVKTNLERRKNYSVYFEGMFKNTFANYMPLTDKDTITKATVKYVIVSDPAFQSALQPFIQWKTKKGFTVIEAYTDDVLVGNTTTSIKNYLKGLYDAATPSDPAPTFVLLVGDVAQVPAFNGTTETHVTDLYYCEYTGDFLPEVYYGRFSATNVSELQPQIDKTLEYEKYLMPDPSFLDSVVMIAGQDPTYGPLHGDGQINYGTSTYFNPAHGLYSNTYLYAVSGSSASQIIQNVSEGVGFANYTAHGSSDGWADPAFSISDISGLQNAHKYPLMIGNCCLTSTFDGDCFGEEIVRASNKGALGYIGGSNSTYWDEDFWFGCGYKTVVVNPTYNASTLGEYDRVFHDHGESYSDWYATQDQMIFAGNLAVTQAGSSLTDYYWEIYHLMGDPSLMVYFGVPSALTATYLPILPLGTSTFTVNTEPYAYVAISMGGVLYGAAFADASGVVNVPITPFSTPGTADVVATKQNRSPFISTVNVANPSGPYIAYNAKVIHDPTGNNNGLADYGETITLDITLENVGSVTATGVSAKLRTSDSYITLTDTTQNWGSITNGNTSTQSNAYSFSIANNIPDQHLVPFTLYITDNNSNTWTASFNMLVNAPDLSIGSVTIDDASGNNNGRLDPGETVDLIISSFNNGNADALNVVSSLTCTLGTVTINNTTDNLGTLAALGGMANATFNVTVSSLAVIGSMADFVNTLTSGGYSVQKNLGQVIGIVNEDWETGTFNKYAWVQSAHPWTLTTTSPFEGIYSAKSGTIANDLTSELSITFEVLSNDSISFYEKVSSEENFDYLKFYIDATQMGSWSGTSITSWSRQAYPVTAGTHTFKWVYDKDVSLSEGSDAAWIDYITFPPVNLASVKEISGDDVLNCYPNPFSTSVTITYTLLNTQDVNIKIVDALGREVGQLVNGRMNPGIYNVQFEAGNLSAGIYHCIVTMDNKTIVKKLVLSR